MALCGKRTEEDFLAEIEKSRNLSINSKYVEHSTGARSHGPWWKEEAGGQGGDKLSAFDGTGGVVWDSGLILCSAVSALWNSFACIGLLFVALLAIPGCHCKVYAYEVSCSIKLCHAVGVTW